MTKADCTAHLIRPGGYIEPEPAIVDEHGAYRWPNTSGTYVGIAWLTPEGKLHDRRFFEAEGLPHKTIADPAKLTHLPGEGEPL
jgi:hypothetical protein